MLDNLIETLTPLGYPVRQQGSLLPKENYPPHFFTFWNDAADGSSFYSNTENATVWQYSLNFYSVDPQKANTMLLEAKKLLKAAGWVVTGKGYAVASDEPTHTGRGITILYRENN
jgi:hypothetical protein